MASTDPAVFLVNTAGHTISLRQGKSFSIGRDPDNDLSISDNSVSRHHAVITPAIGGVRLQDLGSSNGTFVNGGRVTDALLTHGDSLRFGGIQFTVQQADVVQPFTYCTGCQERIDADVQFCPKCGYPRYTSSSKIPASTGAAPSTYNYNGRYAGFWRRVVAISIDYLILGIATDLLLLLLSIPLPAIRVAADGTPIFAGSWSGSIVVGTLASWLYFTLLESSPLQATPGKLIFGARVTDLAGRRITFGRANARYWSKILLDSLTLTIGYLMAGWTQRKQALHDKLAETLVVLKPIPH